MDISRDDEGTHCWVYHELSNDFSTRFLLLAPLPRLSANVVVWEHCYSRTQEGSMCKLRYSPSLTGLEAGPHVQLQHR